MQRLIGIFDLAFLLLGTLAISITMMSPVYKVLSVNVPEAEGGSDISEKSTVQVCVSPVEVSVDKQGFTDLSAFKKFMEMNNVLESKVVLSVDSKVSFSWLAKILGILKACGTKEISFEIKEGE